MTSIYKGRYTRAEYFWMTVINIIAMSSIGGAGYMITQNHPVALIIVIVFVIILGNIINSSITVKRQHDIGFSGWYYLLTLLPWVTLIFNNYALNGIFISINTLYCLLLLFIRGEDGPNKFGPNPLTLSIEDKIRQLYDSAVRLEARGEHDKALSLYQTIIHNYPFSDAKTDALNCYNSLLSRRSDSIIVNETGG